MCAQVHPVLVDQTTKKAWPCGRCSIHGSMKGPHGRQGRWCDRDDDAAEMIAPSHESHWEEWRISGYERFGRVGRAALHAFLYVEATVLMWSCIDHAGDCTFIDRRHGAHEGGDYHGDSSSGVEVLNEILKSKIPTKMAKQIFSPAPHPLPIVC